MVDFTNRAVPVLPFGEYKDKPLAEAPSHYLVRVHGTCKLSSGLCAAVTDELARRGVRVTAPAPPRPLRTCPCHPDTKPICFWAGDSLGRRMIRAECRICRRPVDHPPCVPPYSTEADAHASATPILDVLVRLDRARFAATEKGYALRLFETERCSATKSVLALSLGAVAAGVRDGGQGGARQRHPEPKRREDPLRRSIGTLQATRPSGDSHVIDALAPYKEMVAA
jgi:hypothetical protein